MAMNTLTSPVRPAKSAGLNKITARAVDTARIHLRTGNPGAYARALAGEHRSTNPRQQAAIEAVIIADGMSRLFMRHAANGCWTISAPVAT